MLFLHNIVNGFWLIDENFAANYMPLVTNYLLGQRIQFTENRIPENFLSIQNGDDSREQIKSLKDAPVNSIAVINISGAITKHDQECGPDGMSSKASILQECYHNENIKGIIIKIDSGGGEGNGMRLLCENLSNRNKPVVAFIDDFACSAAYGIASNADVVIANSAQARIGSIGTYLTIADYSKQLEMKGIKLIEVYATASKDKNQEYFQALKGNMEPLKKIADHFNETFLKMIETNRGDKLTSDRSVWGTGKVFFAEEAQELGLIDGIDTFNNILNYFV